MPKQYATIRLDDLELVHQAKIRAVQDKITLLAIVQIALKEYLSKV